jgi:hypothetical protein
MLALVEATDAPFYDREAIETLFGVRRRQAINLAHRLGTRAMGTSLLVPRANLVSFLKAELEGRDYQADQDRLRRVREGLLEAQRQLDARRVKLTVPVGIRTLAHLPLGVAVGPGRVEVTGSDAQDLLQKLFALSRAIAGDMKAFEDATRVFASRDGKDHGLAST